MIDASTKRKHEMELRDVALKAATQEWQKMPKVMELCKQQAAWIKESDQLRIAINKGVKVGVSDHELLLDAIQCIALMIGDRSFYDRNKKGIEGRQER